VRKAAQGQRAGSVNGGFVSESCTSGFGRVQAYASASCRANEADVEQIADLLHGKEEHVWADSGYRGAHTRVARDGLQWHIAARPSYIAKLPEGRAKQRLKRQVRSKASVRAKVEHPFRVIKRQFGLAKVRFRGLGKNTAQVVTLFALSNLWIARKKLMTMVRAVRP
jgi:IS5 family transposase